jgi:hypothetical protein
MAVSLRTHLLRRRPLVSSRKRLSRAVPVRARVLVPVYPSPSRMVTRSGRCAAGLRGRTPAGVARGRCSSPLEMRASRASCQRVVSPQNDESPPKRADPPPLKHGTPRGAEL